MEVIILAGGLGTRLSHIVSDVPKPMAIVAGVPFLVYVFEYLSEYNVKKVILATGYKTEIIEKYFADKYKGIDIEYSVEKEPLGTGGSMKKALAFCRDTDVCVLNGDTYFNVDLLKMHKFHMESGAVLTVGLKKMFDFDRYGIVEFEGNDIIKFNEKKQSKEGFINGGVYFIKRNALDFISKKSFSFEREYLEKLVSGGKFKAFVSEGYFVDIGVPEDYYKANVDLKIN